MVFARRFVAVGAWALPPRVHSDDLAAFVSQAHHSMTQRFHHLELHLHRNGVRQSPGSPAWYMAASHAAKPLSKNITQAALMAEETTKYMAHALGVRGWELQDVDVSGTNLEEICTRSGVEARSGGGMTCQPRKYRSMSGHCNNVQHPHWGSASMPYIRLLPPDYADSISLPRGTALYPQGLPSSREVSLAVHSQLDREHSHLVAVAALWSQLISHDLSHTPQMTGYNGERLKCCGVEFSEFHPECFPIRLPDGDPVHGSARCQHYTRSASAPRPHCALGPREQLNEATAFLDASPVYGTSQAESDSLRLFKSGLLDLREGLLPPDNTSDCRPSKVHRCFKSGDSRVNEHTGLAALHTVWAREHNRLARQLARLNPHWLDEILFQEARRIVIAQLQYITYSEFLPLILGQDTMAAHELMLLRDGYFDDYSISIDPSIANSVATTALHFSLSLMPTHLKVYSEQGVEMGTELLGDSFYAPFQIYTKSGLEKVIRSLLKTPALSNNQHINSIFTDHMFQQPDGDGGGLDLVAQLIQQGRDHGIPSYVQWRKFCHKKTIFSFDDLLKDMSQEAVTGLKSVYRNVSDIDLLSGSLSEEVPEGATVGPTLRCLLATQFKALRRGDRHWFENSLPESAFTKQQLSSIREGTSLARLLCDNTKISAVQPNAFLAQDDYLNALMSCESGTIRRLDLQPWKEVRPLVVLPTNLLTKTFENAHKDLMDIHKQEWNLFSLNMMADPQSPVGTAFGFNRPKRQAAKIANTSLMLEFASSRIVRSFLKGELQDIEAQDVMSLVSSLPYVNLDSLENVDSVPECLESELPCDYTNKYRTISGWCNNLDHPEFGQSFRTFVRLLTPVYSDGVESPRSLSVRGSPLPSPRLISSNVHTDASRPHTRYTLMVMQFAQITDHDLTFTPVNKAFIGEGILNCKSCDSKKTVHPQCFPIPIPDGDPYFPSKGHNGERLCIPATRSMPGQKTLGPREQMNQLTAYLDLSFVYGSDMCEARILRSYSGGKLNTTRYKGKQLLPQTSSNLECRAPSGLCFNAGDDRASEQPSLGSLHTVWLREHNRIATEFSRINPQWPDEKLYQETRRLLGAIYQHITFSEFLPRILGWDAIRKYELDLVHDDYYFGYDPTCDVTIVNEFSAGAFRFGHSLLRPTFRRVSPDFSLKEPPIRLRDHFFNPEVLYSPSIIDELILGLIDTPMETLDNFVTEEVTNHLFENKSIPFSGMDLISLNIQRARDHGIPGYNNYRELCNLTRAQSFQQLLDTTPKSLVSKLSTLYHHVDDIDLFPGGMSESPLPGGVIGPTFACIVGQQFRKIRKCDRFWYENGNEFTRFTPTQLAEIRKVTLASLLCNNLENIRIIQRSVFDLPDPFMNPRIDCNSIQKIDLTKWRKRASCLVESINIDIGTTANISPCVTCTCTKEGPLCQSVKVKNCLLLLQSFNPKLVISDTVCKVQCLFVFNAIKGKSDNIFS